MTLISFLLILVVSNLISAFTTFFFSEDLYLLVSSPVTLHRIYIARFTETMVHASWMVLLMAVPVFAALGRVFDAGWKFYLGAPLTVVPLAMIPTAAGVVIAMLLVNIFVARRTKEILSFLSVAIFGGMLIAFRFIRPEKALIGHQMDSMVSFFSLLRSPDSPISPHYWATRVLLDLLGLRQGDGLFFGLMLASAAVGGLSIGYYVTLLLYRRGFKPRAGSCNMPGVRPWMESATAGTIPKAAARPVARAGAQGPTRVRSRPRANGASCCCLPE